MPRPSFKSTADKQKMVKSMATLGLTHKQMAIAIGIPHQRRYGSIFASN